MNPSDEANRGAEQRFNALRSLLGARRSAPPLVRAPPATECPASFAQEGLWFLDRLAPGGTAYNLAVACRLGGSLDVDAVARSLAELVQRHEILRATLRMSGGQLVQRLEGASALVFRTEDGDESDVATWAARRAAEPFDLARGPLFRAWLLRIADGDHCLLLSQHHAICDAWSFEILMHELCALYAAFTQARASPLGELALQYADFASWQRQGAGEAGERLLAYWNGRLGGVLPTLRLPTDRPRGSDPSRQGAHVECTFPTALGAALKAVGKRQGATLYMVLLAAFKTLLHRLTGDEDVIVGSPVSNRNRVDLEGMVGLFINTLALRTDLGGQPTFRQLLARVRETVTGAVAHQDLPFEVLVKALRLNRAANSPLFRVMFAFQNVPRMGWNWPGLRSTAWNVPSGGAKFDLTLTMQEQPQGLTALLEYDADLFEAATITRLLGQLGTLLDAIVVDPDQAIATLPLLPLSEKRRVLTAWNETTTGYERDLGIHRVFEARAREAPDAAALVSGTDTVTYAELNRRANRLARRLVQMALGREARIGLCLDRSPGLVVAHLAILKAGAAYVPIAPGTPPPRVAQLLRDVAAVVTEASWLMLVAGTGAPKVRVDEPSLTDEADGNLDGDISSESLAYVMFTSGSTGTPRGVCVPHRGVVRLVRGTTYARFATDDVYLQLAPIAFDAATFELWGALLNGATLVLPPPRPLSVADIGALIQRHGVTTLWLTANLFELFVDGGIESKLGSLRQLLTGGDVMSVRHADTFLRRMRSCRLYNAYGPTENTTFTSVHLVERVEPGRGIPIGRPIANTKLYVLDARLQPVPVGVVGELCTSGDGVARGYLDDPEATRERFVASPFVAGQVLYKTGDLARQRADGLVEFVGRTDDQVKIRGFRVDPAEVERSLRACQGIARVAVRAEARATGERRLVAYVVPETWDNELPSKLRGHLRAELPEHLVPSEFVLVADLPLTANGKWDRLAPPAIVRRIAPIGFVAPRDAWEKTLAAIFCRTLGREDVGVHDTFFDLGGDSLSAVGIAIELERETGREFPLALLFAKPTIANLAAELQRRSSPSIGLGPGVVRLKEGGDGRPLFLVAGGRGGKADLVSCAKVVSRLNGAASVFGLLAPGTGTTVEEIAATQLTRLRRLQARGPYRVGGDCIGGVVAYEMARQLFAHGDELELVLLLDTWCPTTRGVIHHTLIEHPWTLLKAGLAFLSELSGRAPDAEPWPAELWRRAFASPEAKRYIQACMRYRPAPYPGRVTLVASDDNLRRGLSDAWKALCGGDLVIHRVPGDHESFSRRYFEQTAEQLRICLEEEGPVERKAEHELTR